MFFWPPGVKHEDAGLSAIAVDDGDLTFTKTFTLLGSMLAYDLEDNDSIECKFKSAQGAFSTIQKQFFSVQKELRIHKRRLHMKG
jgi:hypothetical protein